MISSLLSTVKTVITILAFLCGIPLVREKALALKAKIRKQISRPDEGSIHRGDIVVNPTNPKECEQRGPFCGVCPFRGECKNPDQVQATYWPAMWEL